MRRANWYWHFAVPNRLTDLSADIGDIVADGLAIDQIVDMYNDWQRLKAPKGTTYRAAKFEYLPVETRAYQEAMLFPDRPESESSSDC